MIFRHRIKKILIPDHEPPRYAQAILQAKVNGGAYTEPPHHKRIWPVGTWLQKRLGEIRKG